MYLLLAMFIEQIAQHITVNLDMEFEKKYSRHMRNKVLESFAFDFAVRTHR